MSKIHITLVGGQPVPTFIGVMDDNPDQIILVHSSQSLPEAENITKQIYDKLGKNCVKKEFNPFDFNSIRQQIQELTTFFDADEISVNITSGSKPWSILFYEYFSRKENACVFFVDQQNKVWNVKTGESRRAKYTPTTLEIFTLNKTKLKDYFDFKNYKKEDFDVIPLIRNIRSKNVGAFHRITGLFHENPGGNYQEDPYGYSSIKWDKESNTYLCEIYGDRYGSGKDVFDVSSPNIEKLMLNTGWFELEVAQFLSDWSLAKEIWLNCIFAGTSSSSINPQNEIDIIVKTEDKILFVECKTQIYNITDIDKYNNAVKNYGGLAAKRIFMTDKNCKYDAKVKFEQLEMPFFSLQDLKRDCRKRNEFYDFLNKMINESNKK